MNKAILYLLAVALLPSLGACKKKNTQPEEYFSFDADGVHYEYLQEKGTGFTGNWETIGAGTTSATVGYIITAYSLKDLAAPGRFTFYLGANHFPTKDTFILDGACHVSINGFLSQDNNYSCQPPLTGKIIFTERSNAKLTGTFEFEAYKYIPDPNQMGQVMYTDTILHITNGKFSIIP